MKTDGVIMKAKHDVKAARWYAANHDMLSWQRWRRGVFVCIYREKHNKMKISCTPIARRTDGAAATQSRLFSPNGRRAHGGGWGLAGYCNRVEKNSLREMRRSSPLQPLPPQQQCARGQQVGASKCADDNVLTQTHARTPSSTARQLSSSLSFTVFIRTHIIM